MKLKALITIIVSELLLFMLTSLDINPNMISFISTLVVIAVVSFFVSSLLQNFKKLTSSKKFTISGIIGVAVGILYFWEINTNFDLVTAWLNNFGVITLLGIILICALFLFFSKKPNKSKPITTTNDITNSQL